MHTPLFNAYLMSQGQFITSWGHGFRSLAWFENGTNSVAARSCWDALGSCSTSTSIPILGGCFTSISTCVVFAVLACPLFTLLICPSEEQD